MSEEFKMSSSTYVDELGNMYFDVALTINGVLSTKRLKAEDYVNMIRESIDVQRGYFEIPKVSQNIYRLYVDPGDPETYTAFCLFPKGERAFCYLGKHYRIPFPTLVGKVIVNKGVRSKMFLYALDTDEPTLDSGLFYYPFGNVNLTDGVCCTGNIHSSAPFYAADGHFLAFFDGETNEDWWRQEKCNLHFPSQGKLVEALKKKSEYPKEYLGATRFTFGEFLKTE